MLLHACEEHVDRRRWCRYSDVFKVLRHWRFFENKPLGCEVWLKSVRSFRPLYNKILPHSSALKMKSLRSSETPPIFYQSDTSHNALLFAKFIVFWDVILCSLVDCYRHLGGKYSLCHHRKLHPSPSLFYLLFLFQCYYFFFFIYFFLPLIEFHFFLLESPPLYFISSLP